MIYIVEDDAAIRELEQYALQSSGYEVASFESSEPFWQAMHAAEPELVILDVMLPGEDGFSILKKLRNTPSLRRLPIIMVTAKSSELDTVRGLDCGADDYITKPFGIMEFLSRVRAALRRSAPEARPNVLSFHEILLDDARHNVTVSGTPVELTYKEYSLLRLLLENTNLVVTRETILQVVWGTDISVESRTVDMHIRTLRKKLGDAGKYICTVRKVGYKLTVSGTPVELTYKEYSLLRLLLENTNLVVTRETILQVVWGTDISVESRTVDMHIRTLRKKLGDAGKYICTVRKVGYKLTDEEEAGEE